VLSVVMEIPTIWIWAMIALAVLSCIQLDHPAHGGLAVSFSVGTTTVAVVALIWLPALLRLLSLTGGRVKAAGLEASAKGLLGSPEDLIIGLADIRAGAEEAKRQAPEAAKPLQGVTEQIDQIAAHLGAEEAITEDAITRLAGRYKDLRASMNPGDERTFEMTRVVNEAQVRAAADPDTAKRLGPSLIRSEDQGERIVGLAFLQEAPANSAFHDVLALVRESATAFEMFHALLALEELAPLLRSRERREAIETLRAEKEDPRQVGVMNDSNLPSLIDVVIGALENS
jgi:hypothetical protein